MSLYSKDLMLKENAPSQPAPSDEAVNEFRVAEYEELRKEVLERLKELWALEKFAFGGAAAIAAWLLTHRTEVGSDATAWTLPFAFLVICLVRFISGMHHLGSRASSYLIRVEEHYLGKSGGWEVWFRPQRANESWAHGLAWGVAVAFSIALLVLMRP